MKTIGIMTFLVVIQFSLMAQNEDKLENQVIQLTNKAEKLEKKINKNDKLVKNLFSTHNLDVQKINQLITSREAEFKIQKDSIQLLKTEVNATKLALVGIEAHRHLHSNRLKAIFFFCVLLFLITLVLFIVYFRKMNVQKKNFDQLIDKVRNETEVELALLKKKMDDEIGFIKIDLSRRLK